MRERLITRSGGVILADEGISLDWSLDHFDPDRWRAMGVPVETRSGGRGAVSVIRRGDDEWVLRHYRRGGMVARVLDDHYLWLGRDRTRSFREWRLMGRLFETGLPVPRPIAAAFRRSGMAYTADLITQRIPGARPLSRHLAEAALPERGWRRLGACVRQIGRAHV